MAKKKFETLHGEDQLRIALEALRMMCEGKHRTLEKLASANDQTPIELWRHVCAEVGFDECEPWEGFPAGPKRENWKGMPGGDREASDHVKKLLEQMRALTGKDKS